MAATVEMGPLVTLQNVPLLELGIDYPASTGPLTITDTIMDSIIESQADPNIPATRIKIGHMDNPIDDDLQELWDQTREELDANDSTPAVGTIANMHKSDDGITLLGDLVGIPQWLADIMASAYPARSIEGGEWGPHVAKFETANQKDYAYTLHAIALLGVAWPGCTSLADLQTLFSAEGPEVTVIEMSSKTGGTRMPVQAQVNVEDVRRAFYEEVAQGDRYWWWDRAILLEPDEMIVTDPDAGQLYRLPFSVSGDEVTFSDPNPVKIVYEDTGPPEKEEGAQASVQLAALPNTGKVIASNRNRTEAYAGFRSPDNEEDTLDPKEIRKSVGLAEDASDDELKARLKALNEASEETEVEEPEEEPDETEVEEPEAEEQPEPVAAGTRTLDDDTYNRLVKGAETAEKMAADQAKADRDTTIAEAVKDGKFAPSRKEHWVKLWNSDPEGTKATIASLSAGVIPVGERGSSKPGEASAEDGGSDYPAHWLNQREQDKVKAAAEGTPLRNPRIMVEA